jgi:hypothetical protein
MECEAKTETQHREHKGLSTENAEKEADSPHLKTTRMCPRERGGRHWEITEEKKTACKDALPNLGQAGDAKWAQYRAARNLGRELLYHTNTYCQEHFCTFFKVFLILCFQ